MSCQQVPRLPEDPYTFTEPPATAKYFSSQSHKLQSLHRLPAATLSFDSTANPHPHTKQQQQQHHTNGATTAATALLPPKRKGPIYGKTATRQKQQQQQQQPHQPLQQQQSPSSHPAQPVHVFNGQPNGAQPTKAMRPKLTTTTTSNSSSSTTTTLGRHIPVTPALNALQFYAPATATTALTLPSPSSASYAATCITSVDGAVAAGLKVQSPPAAHLPPTPPSSSPLYAPRYSAAQHVSSNSSIDAALFPARSPAHLHSNSCGQTTAAAPPTPPLLPPPTTTPTTTTTSSASTGRSTPASINFARPAANASKQTSNAKRQTPANTSAAGATTTTAVASDAGSAAPPSKCRPTKRSYSQSAHHEALQRIASPIATPSTNIKVAAAAAANTDSVVATLDAPVEAEEATRPFKSTPAQHAAVVVSFVRPAQRRHRATEWHSPGTDLFELSCNNGPGAADATDDADDDSAANAHRVCSSPPPPALHVQQCWFHPQSRLSTTQNTTPAASPRHHRLHDRLHQLHGQARQLRVAQRSRTLSPSRRRMHAVEQTLSAKVRLVAAEAAANAASRCAVLSCTRTAVLLATHCMAHITMDERQRLFSACTAKFADNSQCRLPAVFDAVGQEMPLCREHAWKRDNYSRILQEQKLPKKAAAPRKKPNRMTTSVASPRPATARRQRTANGKKKQQQQQQSHPTAIQQPTMMVHLSLADATPPATATDTSNSSIVTQQSLMASRSPPNTLNHFTISSNDSFVSSNDATTFASLIGSAEDVTAATSVGGCTNTTTGGAFGLADSLHSMTYGAGSSSAHMSMSGSTTPSTSTVSDSPQYFQPQQFQQQHQPFQQPQSMYGVYGQQPYQQHTHSNTFLSAPRYPPVTQFFAQHSQGSSDTVAVAGATSQQQQQHMFTMSENSSAYESSEDTGIGGLSESEQQLGVVGSGSSGVHGDMHGDDADVILVDNDLTNVLSQLNTTVFEDIFTAQQQLAYKPTQEEDELIDRALEAANSQVISLHNMARDFFSDILDVDDEILEDVDMDAGMVDDDGGDDQVIGAKTIAPAALHDGTSLLVQPNGGSGSATADMHRGGLVHT